MLALAAALALSVVPAASDPASTAAAARTILQGCGAGEANMLAAPDSDWTAVTSLAGEHARLRQTLGSAAALNTPPQISIFSAGGHLATEQISVVLIRDRKGYWRFDLVGESTIWVAGAKPQLFVPEQGVLTPDDSRRVDAILADRCFAAEPTHFNPFDPKKPWPYGVITHTVEVNALGYQRRWQVFGSANGLSGELLAIVGKYPRLRVQE
jgi:hypothetical protein